jgi:hypothetical protein
LAFGRRRWGKMWKRLGKAGWIEMRMNDVKGQDWGSKLARSWKSWKQAE